MVVEVKPAFAELSFRVLKTVKTGASAVVETFSTSLSLYEIRCQHLPESSEHCDVFLNLSDDRSVFVLSAVQEPSK